MALITAHLNTVQLYCLCVEKFAFWLVIYIKRFNKINNKTSTIYIQTFNNAGVIRVVTV